MMLALFLSIGLLFGQTFEPSKNDKLLEIHNNVEMLDKLSENGVMVDPKLKSSLLENASKISDSKITTSEDLNKIVGSKSSLVQRVSGYFTFLNVLLIISSIIIVFASVLLLSHYLAPIIYAIPIPVWLIVFYTISSLLVYSGFYFKDLYLTTVLPGTLGILACVLVNKKLYFNSLPDYLLFGFLTAIFGFIAHLYGDSVIGFMAVMSLLSAVGFVVDVTPGIVSVGFEDRDMVFNGTVSGLFLSILNVYLIQTNSYANLQPFQIGMSICGTFVASIGILILSSRYYYWRIKSHFDRYILFNICAILMGAASLFFGNVYHVPSLAGIGGFFFCLYLLEKYYEIPWSGIGWVWSTFGLGLLLYSFVIMSKMFPEYFVLMLS